MTTNPSPQSQPQKRSGSNKRHRAKGAVLVRLLPEERVAVEEKAREVGLSNASFLRAWWPWHAWSAREAQALRLMPKRLGCATAALNKSRQQSEPDCPRA